MTQLPSGQLSLREHARCHEVIRAQFGGYERCHRYTGREPLPHHVRGRSWSGSWSAATARIQFGVGCDDGCVFGDEVSRWAARVRHLRRHGGSGGAQADSQQQHVNSPAKGARVRRQGLAPLKPQIQDPLFPPLLVVARFGLSPAAEEARYCLVALDRAPRFWLFPTG